MNELFIFFAKSSGILLLFLGLYFLWLRKDTFFQGNRFFLLTGMIISLILPFIVITQYIEIPVIENTIAPNAFVITDTSEKVATTTSFFSWADIIFYVYVAGVLFFLGKFLIELTSLCKLLWTTTVTKRDGQFIYIETMSSFTPFSFFNYIVYNPNLYTKSELAAIITHEQAHSCQFHSIDIFISKLYCIFMWFNPFAWIYQKFISQNLEFLADSAAIKQTPSKKEYQLTLLKVSGNAYCPALTNNFYNSLIKKRIVMLQKNQSTQLSKWKQILILPLLVAFMVLFNTKVIAKEVTTSTPIVKNTFTKNNYGDVIVTITKNTTSKELKAIQKMFKSFDLTLTYDLKKLNSKQEIVAISLELKDTSGGMSSTTFDSSNDKPIPTIKIGKENGTLIISAPKTVLNGNAVTYEVYEDDDNDGKKRKGKYKYVIKSKGSNESSIKKEAIVIVNGKRVSSDTVIEKEIEIDEDSKGGNYIFIGTSEEKNSNVKVDEKENNIVFRNPENENPLFVVDGKIVDKNKVYGISPNNIASISVLKGDNAIKKYGDKAKDGAIIIVTKKKK